jgi:hypothetical protein
MSVPAPQWAREDPSDKLNLLFKAASDVFANGIVVWGHLVQANSLLFQEGTDDCPGEVLFSLDEKRQVEPEYLQCLARMLFSMKGKPQDDPRLQRYADILADELTRSFGRPVPREINPEHDCRTSATYFMRKHLPNRRLSASLLPLVVSPREPHFALPLPAKFWPGQLVEWWNG